MSENIERVIFRVIDQKLQITIFPALSYILHSMLSLGARKVRRKARGSNQFLGKIRIRMKGLNQCSRNSFTELRIWKFVKNFQPDRPSLNFNVATQFNGMFQWNLEIFCGSLHW
jgi:hypothetical protein